MTLFIELLKEELIFIDVEAHSKAEAITFLANHLCKAGCVKETYLQAILEREAEFPTGLQAKGCGVAIPHTDPIHVNTEVVSLAVLRSPVHFHILGMNDEEVEVELIFMLALKNPQGHLDMLQELTEIFKNPHGLQRIKQAKQAKEIIGILHSIHDKL